MDVIVTTLATDEQSVYRRGPRASSWMQFRISHGPAVAKKGLDPREKPAAS